MKPHAIGEALAQPVQLPLLKRLVTTRAHCIRYEDCQPLARAVDGPTVQEDELSREYFSTCQRCGRRTWVSERKDLA